MKPFIALDFDNTLACYDQLMHELALEQGWIEADFPQNKQLIRDHLRSLDQGELLWQRLQGMAYGPYMLKAKPFPEALDTLQAWSKAEIPLVIISHKTPYAPHDPTRTNLQDQALCWLEQENFFKGTGLSPNQVFFAPSREEKVRQIAACKCTHFIDDLVETFLEKTFPSSVCKILFSPFKTQQPGIIRASTWREIRMFVDKDLKHRKASKAPVQDKVARDCERLLGIRPTEIREISSGFNSRVFGLRFAQHPPLVSKYYTGVTANGRPRGEADFKNHQLLWQAGERAIAQPLAISPAQDYALYTYLEGENIPCAQAGKKEIKQCLQFLFRINQLDITPRPGPASEACFSLSELKTNLCKRYQLLTQTQGKQKEDLALHSFLKAEVRPLLHQALVRAEQLIPGQRLPQELCWLSPSDFGLHNALKKDGQLYFLDFEHLGYDDPVKTCADFLLHPQMQDLGPLGEYFVSQVEQAWQDRDPGFKVRFTAFFPLFAIKWTFILLNEFLPQAQIRRSKVLGKPITPEILEKQLTKARTMLAKAAAALDGRQSDLGKPALAHQDRQTTSTNFRIKK